MFQKLRGTVEFISSRLQSPHMSDIFIASLDEIIDIEVPEQTTIEVYPKNENVERLMALMAEGTKKIEAIKEHRAITGYGLKDSKDAVEWYWKPQPTKVSDIPFDPCVNANHLDAFK